MARQQVEAGAQVIDVQHGRGNARRRDGHDQIPQTGRPKPDIARVPIMIDSSKWSIIEAGLKCVQGKLIINSISLKEWRG